MADIEITDEASLEAWLKTRPRRDAELIAFRAAARVFPLWGRAMEEEWAKGKGFSSLNCFSILLSVQTRTGVTGAHFGADQNYLPYEIAESSKYAIMASIHALVGVRQNVENNGPIRTVMSADNAARSYSAARGRKVTFDAVSRDSRNGDLYRSDSTNPLWPTPAPDWFTTADLETRAIWAKDPATWAFWERWWDGVISGDMPFPEGLLRDVALIEDDIWQAGPKAVAEAIAKIEKIHDLRAQLAVLTQAMEDEDLSQVQRGATLAHRGHNNPPEIIEAYEIVQASAVDIAQALHDAREELAKPAPEPSRLQALGNWMLSSIMKAAGYCGGLADKFLQEFAGEMGKQAATVVAWLIKGGIGVSLLTAFAKSMISVWPI